MLNLVIGTDWVKNRAYILDLIAQDVKNQKGGRILMVPEPISHDSERRLCAAAGDTTSRFAEVLSFTRLARRVADDRDRAEYACLDNGGRIVAMAAAVQQVQSQLKSYASLGTRPEFLLGLVETVDEFKRCCITSKDLRIASEQSTGVLAQKLEELSLIFESYDAVCYRGKRDPRDQLTWLLEELEEGGYSQTHTFYFDGFPDFSSQQMAILEHLICCCPDLTVSLTCDRIGSTQMAFERAGNTAFTLCEIAKKCGIKVTVKQIDGEVAELKQVSCHLFQGETELKAKSLQLYRSESVYQECISAAERILSLVHSGSRYRDVSVVCADFAGYRNVIRSVFVRCGIPLYLSGTEQILERSVVATVLSAIDTAISGFEQKDVLRYMKTSLSPLDLDTSDTLENYAILWGISGREWTREWSHHPKGLGEKWNDSATAEIRQINSARLQIIEPLDRLRNGLLSAKNVAQLIEALYAFFEEIQLASQLREMAGNLEEQGNSREAQILNQLWEILLTALEQMYDVLGGYAWAPDLFTRLFKLLLSQYDVGTIPATLDSVTVGSVNAMRCHETKHLFVLGASEGFLPAYGTASGVLSEKERTALQSLGLHLAGGAADGLQTEFTNIYTVFSGAQDSVTVSCPAGQPSFVFRRLMKMAASEENVTMTVGPALVDRTEAAAYLIRNGTSAAPGMLDLGEAFESILRKRTYTLGTVSADHIRSLYGRKLRLSASQVDKQADCRFAYFLRYGLGVKERKTVSVDPAEFGTYVHAVLEKTVADVMQMGGFKNVSVEQTLTIAQSYSDAYTAERFSELETQRMSYLFKRNSHELAMIVRELWCELNESEFEPVFFELQFGDDGAVPAIPINGRMIDAQLRGFVDRVDIWRRDGKDYFRVVDYKTGAKDFDYCDVFNGLGLQMLLYLFALEEKGIDLIGAQPVPAGVQYFPARAPMVSADGYLDDAQAAAVRNKIWKRKGLVLRDEQVLEAMEPGDTPLRLPYTRKKDGTLSGDLAGSDEFALLKQYIFRLLGDMVDQIASGCVAPNPYTRGGSHDACRYCPYGSICHVADVEGRRNYKAVSSDEFWDRVRKEMRSND